MNIDQMTSLYPEVAREVEKATGLHPRGIGVTGKNNEPAFSVRLPKMPETAGPDHIAGFQVVYEVMEAPRTVGHGVKRAVGGRRRWP